MPATKLMRAAAASLHSRHTEDLLTHHMAVLLNPATVLSLLIHLSLPTALTPPSPPTVPNPLMAVPLTVSTAVGVLRPLLVPLATAADTLVTRLGPLPATVVTAAVHQVVVLPTPIAAQ